MSNLSSYALRKLHASKHREIAGKIIESRDSGRLKHGNITRMIDAERQHFLFVSGTAVANHVKIMDQKKGIEWLWTMESNIATMH